MDFKKLLNLSTFVAKNTSVGEHAMAAGMGAGAMGIRNLIQGRDMTDGMVSGAFLGAAGGVGLKAYANRGMASKVSGLMEKADKSLEAFKTTSKASGTGRKALWREYSQVSRQLDDVGREMGLSGVRRAKPPVRLAANRGSGPIAESVSRVSSQSTIHTTTAASTPAQSNPLFQPSVRSRMLSGTGQRGPSGLSNASRTVKVDDYRFSSHPGVTQRYKRNASTLRNAVSDMRL